MNKFWSFLTNINDLSLGISLNNKLFGDSTSIFSVECDIQKSANDMTKDLKAISKWENYCKISFNPEPTRQPQEVVFCRKITKTISLCFWIRLQCRVQLIFLKCCRENLSFRNLMLSEKEWKYVAQQISQAHRAINFSQLLKWILLSETYSFSGSTNISLIEFNSNNNKVQNMFKVNNRTTRRSSVVFIVNFQ